MADINLLPQQQTNTKVASRAKKYGTYASLFLITLSLIYGTIYGFFYLSGTISSSSTDKLENDIKALQSTEQKMVLIRDRLSKASSILATASANDESLSFTGINATLPEGIVIQNSKLSPSEFTLSVKADSSQQIGEFIRSLVNSKKYAQIDLISMTFNAKDRYFVEIKIKNIESN